MKPRYLSFIYLLIQTLRILCYTFKFLCIVDGACAEDEHFMDENNIILVTNRFEKYSNFTIQTVPWLLLQKQLHNSEDIKSLAEITDATQMLCILDATKRKKTGYLEW